MDTDKHRFIQYLMNRCIWLGNVNVGFGKSEIEKGLERDVQGFGDAGASFDGRGVDAAFDETDELDGVFRFFRQLLLRETFGLSQFRNVLT